MAYQFIDGYGSILTADSSIVSGSGVTGTIRPVIQVGSFLTAVPTTASGNQSVSGTVGASVIGLTPVTFSGSPSISGAVTVLGNPSISGTVNIGNVPQASVHGNVGVTNTNFSVSGAISISNIPQASVHGAVSIAGGGLNVNNFPTNQNVSGSVIAFQAGTQSSSVYGIRNDAVASFLGADLTARPVALDSAGRTLIRPFAAEEARIEGYNSVVSTSVTTLVGAAGAGLRNYITDLWFANSGSVATLVTFRSGGGTSVLGYTIVPGGSGSNLPGLAMPIRTLANETFDIQATTAVSVLYGTVKGYKGP